MLELRLFALFLLATPSVALAQSCPDIHPDSGYPVSAMSADGGVTAEWLAAVVRSAAYRWRVPSRRRSAHVGWERVHRRVLPPEPRWADDWKPGDAHRASANLVLHRVGRRNRLELVEGSGDEAFDESLESIVHSPMPASLDLPPLPAGAGDSIVVRLTFGSVPGDSTAALIRFAAHQTPGRLEHGTLRVEPPAGHRGSFPALTVKYDISEQGTVSPASLEFVRSPGRAFEEAVRDGLARARFVAPTSNCRPVAQSVVQTFGR